MACPASYCRAMARQPVYDSDTSSLSLERVVGSARLASDAATTLDDGSMYKRRPVRLRPRTQGSGNGNGNSRVAMGKALGR